MAADSDDDKASPCCQLTPKWLSTGDMARLSGTTLRTVRFYETEGLITPDTREVSEHRRFAPAELRKLQCISGLREAGLSLQDIKTLIGIKRRCPTAENAAASLMSALNERIDEMQQRIGVLQRVRAELCATVEALMRSCKDCDAPSFPSNCGSCEHLDDQDATGATHLLWKN